jgi:hypothetical protein
MYGFFSDNFLGAILQPPPYKKYRRTFFRLSVNFFSVNARGDSAARSSLGLVSDLSGSAITDTVSVIAVFRQKPHIVNWFTIPLNQLIKDMTEAALEIKPNLKIWLKIWYLSIGGKLGRQSDFGRRKGKQST